MDGLATERVESKKKLMSLEQVQSGRYSIKPSNVPSSFQVSPRSSRTGGNTNIFNYHTSSKNSINTESTFQRTST